MLCVIYIYKHNGIIETIAQVCVFYLTNRFVQTQVQKSWVQGSCYYNIFEISIIVKSIFIHKISMMCENVFVRGAWSNTVFAVRDQNLKRR